ncbi:uncharacterized protein [Cherax quadricarinatus]|uniref:uncharacterized protein n=1 Tax=Cherax quadricarinatus TaxID=27406 RepID=UPI00387EDDD2
MGEVPELEYVVLTMEDYEDVTHFLLNYYYPRNTVALGTRCSPETALSVDLKHIQLCLTSGLSVGARDKATKNLIAMSLASNYEHYAEATQNPEHEVGILRAWYITRKLMDEVVGTKRERIVYGTRICVLPDYSHLGVSTKVAKLCLDLCIKQGYTLACTNTINLYAEKASLRLGFENVKTVDLSTLEEGIFDLSRMDYKILKIFIKRLRPETKLSSKL